jgi:hypothetical protein
MLLWKTYTLAENVIHAARIGPLRIRIKYFNKDCYIATDRPDGPPDVCGFIEEQGVEEQESISWERWMLGSSVKQAGIVPVMPDRPLVIRPDMTTRIPSGHTVSFFITIPVWVRITSGEKNPIQLCEIPIVILSDSWFGDIPSGEFCYSLYTDLRRTLDDTAICPYEVVCPVTIKNNSKLELTFQRFSLYVPNLAIFQGKSRLWSNQVSIVFQGETQESQIHISEKKPDIEAIEYLLSAPREKMDKNLVKKSFELFKTIAGF